MGSQGDGRMLGSLQEFAACTPSLPLQQPKVGASERQTTPERADRDQMLAIKRVVWE